MTLWDSLFNPVARSSEVNTLKRRVEQDSRFADLIQEKINILARRLDRQELVEEALFRHLEGKGLLTREEFALAVQQLDLADGFEDGCLGPDRMVEAPKCPHCARPRNPKRADCIFCGEEIRPEDVAQASERPVEFVRCCKCFQRVRKNDAVSTPEGYQCLGCQG